MSFSRAFLAGMQAREARDKRKEEEARKAEFASIATAKPEQLTGYTEQDGADLEAAAASGQYDIGMKANEDGSFGGYTVTPKAGPTQTGAIAMRGVTDFLGNRTAGNLNESQISNARQRAMAGVMMKSDPLTGTRMLRDITRDEREDERFGQEKKQWGQQEKQWNRQEQEWERADKDRAREDQYREDRTRLLQTSPAGQFQAANAKYEQDMAAYQESLKAGKPGVPPVAPQRPGPMQTMAGYAGLIALDYEHGKLNTDGLIQFQEKMRNLEKENYAKALLVAQNGGTPQQIAEAFNEVGTKIDPKGVTLSRTKQANGPDLVTLGYKDEKGQTVSTNVMAELEAYDQAKRVYDSFYQGEANRRGNEQLQLSKNADARAGANAAQGQADRAMDAKARTARFNLWREQNPKATPAQIEAAKQGILSPSVPGNGDKYNVEMSDVTSALGSPALDRNGNPRMDPLTGKQMINRDPKREAEFFQWMRDNNITDTNKGIALFMGQKQKATSIATDPRAIAIRDDKSLTVEQKRKKLQELGYK